MTPTTHPGILRLCQRLGHYARRRWAAMGAVLGTQLVGAGLNALKPWPMKVLVDNVLGHKPLTGQLRHIVDALPGAHTPQNLLGWTVGATVVLFVLGWTLSVITTYASIGFGAQMQFDLAADLFAHLQRLSLRFHTHHGIGDSIRRVTTDSTCVTTIIQDALLPVAASIFSLATMVFIMWQLDQTLTMLSLGVAPFMIVALRRYSRPMSDRSYEQHEVEGRMYDTIEQTLEAIPVIQAFSGERERDNRFRNDTRDALDAYLVTTDTQLRFRIAVGLCSAVGTAGVLWIGATHALHGQLTVGTILVFLSYLAALYGPIEALMYSSSTVQAAAGSARRVMEVLDAEPEVTDAPGAVALRRVRGHVVFDDVGFGYEPDRPVLQNVSLEARPGETVAIVGHTGAGKSTLVSLVLRLFDPTDGTVSIDGHDLRDVQVASLRSQVSLVLQESFLFPISIRDNIAYGRPDASMKQIQAAAKAANAHEFIAKLPDGYDTIVGERGATLSGGERQRIAIARALLKDAPVLILDEPTSALDARTESLLLEALERLTKGRTTLIIAHRLSTIRNADRIVVLNEGRVVETGTHRQLVRRKGPYAALRNPGPAGTKVRVK
jgi:ATP-binding cassette, subfamily B, bacterial